MRDMGGGADMSKTTNEIVKLTLDELVKRFAIQNEKEYELLKNGKTYIDSAFDVIDENSRIKIANALMEYLIYKRNGGK